MMASAIEDPKFQSAFNVVKGSVPARTDVPNTDFDDCGKKGMADLAEANEKGTLFGSMAHGHAAPASVKNAMYDVITRHFNGEIDRRSGLPQFAAAVEARQVDHITARRSANFALAIHRGDSGWSDAPPFCIGTPGSRSQPMPTRNRLQNACRNSCLRRVSRQSSSSFMPLFFIPATCRSPIPRCCRPTASSGSKTTRGCGGCRIGGVR